MCLVFTARPVASREPMTLVAENLSIRRGERTILSGVSFVVAAGHALILTGPNGAGKTTLLRTIAGLLAPAGGSLRLDGARDAATTGDAIAEHCHFVGHLNAIKPALSVIENAEFWASYLGGPADGVMAALERFRMADLASVQAGLLSAGQKRRLGLSRLLLAPRPVWLLDEPAVSLDTASQDLLAVAVNEHLAGGGIVLAATHQRLAFSPAGEFRLTPSRTAAHETHDVYGAMTRAATGTDAR